MERRAQIMQWLKAILAKHLSAMPYSAFVFGSQANLSTLKRADIDVGILANQSIPVQKMAAIHQEIDHLPMLYKIDIVDFFEADDTFILVAMRNVEML